LPTFSPPARADARKWSRASGCANLRIARKDLATGMQILNRARDKKVGTLLPA
jgi:hypothetical protein